MLVVVGSDVDLMYAPSRAVRLSGAFAIMQISHFPKYERTLSLKEERELFLSIVTLYGCHFDTRRNQSTAIPPYQYCKGGIVFDFQNCKNYKNKDGKRQGRGMIAVPVLYKSNKCICYSHRVAFGQPISG